MQSVISLLIATSGVCTGPFVSITEPNAPPIHLIANAITIAIANVIMINKS